MSGIPSEAWILIADGEKALILRNEGDHEQPSFQVVRIFEQDNPSTSEQGQDRPGRFNDGPSVHRSAMEETDWHRFEKLRFAADVAECLYKAAHAGRFHDLIVAAPPLVLGELRKHYHSEVKDRLLIEINKTFTGHPIEEIECRVVEAASELHLGQRKFLEPSESTVPGRILGAKN